MSGVARFLDWLIDKFDPIPPLPPNLFDDDDPALYGEYPPLTAEQFTPDVPAGGVDTAQLNSPRAAAQSAAGGHPQSTSELLSRAAEVLRSAYLLMVRTDSRVDDIEGPLLERRIVALLPDVRDRAAQFAAEGD